MRTISLIFMLFLSLCLANPKPDYNYEYRNHHDHGHHKDHHHHRHYHRHHKEPENQEIKLSPWAQAHMDEVKRMADLMRQEFNMNAYGRRNGDLSYSSSYSTSSSSTNFPSIAGKTQEELDMIAKEMTEEMIANMKNGKITYTQITQPNWFENQAALKLETLDEEDDDSMLQQQSQNVFNTGFESNPTEVENLNSNFDEIAHVNYPPSIAVIDGKRYVTRKNCTTVTSSNNGETVPTYGTSSSNTHFQYRQEKSTIEESEPRPVYSGGPNYNSKDSIYQEKVTNNPVYIPIVEDDKYERDQFSRDTQQQQTYYPDFNFTNNNSGSNYGHFNVGNQFVVQTPAHQAKVTISHLNRTITGGTGLQYPHVTGCRGTTVIVNGNVVYNQTQSIGDGSTSCVDSSSSLIEAEWKRKERERLFWLLAQGTLTNQEELQKWQRMNWQQLTQLAQEYKTTVEEIREFQRNELKYYFDTLNIYGSTSDYYQDWQKREKARWDWLIKQNQINQEELARWQQLNHDRIKNLAHIYRISIEELENWQKNELDRIQQIIQQQNVEISRLQEWKNDVQSRLNQLNFQQNISVEQLREIIRQDLLRLENISQFYKIDVEYLRKWLEAQLDMYINLHERDMSRITDWQLEERQRIEHIIREYNLTVDELRERLEMEHRYIRDFANQYHISVEKIREWQNNEIIRLQNEGRLHLARLEAWQKELQDHIKDIIKQHQITTSELEIIIKRDQQLLEDLAHQYHLSLQQLENWYRTEANRIMQFKVENQIKDWQKSERRRIDDIFKQNNYTVEELHHRLIFVDRTFLNQIATSYQIQLEELTKWYEEEIKRLHELGLLRYRVEDLNDWQIEEHNRIMTLIQNQSYTIEDLKERLRHDYERLQILSQQYQISQDQILQWYLEEIQHFLNQGLVQPAENLTEWQIKEQEYINEIVQNSSFTMDDLVQRLQFNRKHLEELARQYHIQISEILEWYKKQAQSLVNRGVIKEFERLTEWQKNQRDYIYEIIQNQEITIEQLERQLIENRNNLQKLSQQFHISVYEIEEWYKKEIQRLINQGFMQINWKQQETEKIMNLIKYQRIMTYEELEKMLFENNAQLYDLAVKYHITIKDLEEWYRNELLRLLEQNVIRRTGVLTQWQIFVRNRLEELSKQQKWTIEELKDRFKQNTDNLYNLIRIHNITIEELTEWYNHELDRLKNEGLIFEKIWDSTLDWKQQEYINLKNLALEYGNSLKRLNELVLHNNILLKDTAAKHHITVKILSDYYNQVINELLSKGIIINDLGNEGDWQQKERERLYYIIEYTRMSYTELLDFLKDDIHYNQLLANGYGINLNTLSDFQMEELRKLINTGYLKKLNLNVLEDWQKRERDHLYSLIKLQGLTKDKLPGWQNINRKDLEDLASQYRISVNNLIEWQQKELQRLDELAYHYNLTLYDLQQFWAAELQRITNAAHKNTLDREFYNWESGEYMRIENLRRRYDFTDVQLWQWRRKLFLYCQGLLNLRCITNNEMRPIDVGRGDQPPNMAPSECEDENEPDVGNPERIPPPTKPVIKPNLPLQTPLAPFPRGTTRIWSFEKNRTEKVVIGPQTHVSGFDNTKEYREESQRPANWYSPPLRPQNSPKPPSTSYGSGYGRGYGSSYGSDSTYPRYDDVQQRQQPNPFSSLNNNRKEYQADQQPEIDDLSQKTEDIGQQTQDLGKELQNAGQEKIFNPQYAPPAKEVEDPSQRRRHLDMPQQPVNKPSKELEDLLRDAEMEGLGPQEVEDPKIHSLVKEVEDMTQKRTPIQKMKNVEDMTSKELEDMIRQSQMENFEQQKIEQPEYPPLTRDIEDETQKRIPTEDIETQRIQKQQYPSAGEIDDLNQQRIKPNPKPHYTGYGPSINVRMSNDNEYPAKVEEINPNLEVEAVQVTEKPKGFWKKIFG